MGYWLHQNALRAVFVSVYSDFTLGHRNDFGRENIYMHSRGALGKPPVVVQILFFLYLIVILHSGRRAAMLLYIAL